MNLKKKRQMLRKRALGQIQLASINLLDCTHVPYTSVTHFLQLNVGKPCGFIVFLFLPLHVLCVYNLLEFSLSDSNRLKTAQCNFYPKLLGTLTGKKKELLSTNMFENQATEDGKHRLRCLNLGTYFLKLWLRK